MAGLLKGCFHVLQLIICDICNYSSSVSHLRIYSELNLEKNQLRSDDQISTRARYHRLVASRDYDLKDNMTAFVTLG